MQIHAEKSHFFYWVKIMGVLCASVLLGIILVKFLFRVESWGHFIPQDDLMVDYGVALLWSMVLGASILFWPVPDEDKTMLFWAWIAKIVIVLGLMLLYENHYYLDAYDYYGRTKTGDFDWGVYFAGSEDMQDFVRSNQIMTNFILTFQRIFMSNSYHAAKLGFSMIGLFGIYFFYQATVVYVGHKNRRLFFALALLPSILFWSSILGKEPITFFGMSLYVYGVMLLYKTQKWHYLILVVLGILIESMIRIWYGMIMLFPLTIFVLYGLKNNGVRILFISILVVVFYLYGDSFMQRFKVETITDVFTSLTAVAKGYATTPGGSNITVHFDFMNPNPTLIMAYIPIGMFTSLFRPLPGEVMNPFGFLVGVENVYLLYLLYLVVKRTHWKELRDPLFVWAILLILMWAVTHAFILNMGTLVRYKLQIMPVLFCFLLYFSRKRTDQERPLANSH